MGDGIHRAADSGEPFLADELQHHFLAFADIKRKGYNADDVAILVALRFNVILKNFFTVFGFDGARLSLEGFINLNKEREGFVNFQYKIPGMFFDKFFRVQLQRCQPRPF